MGPLLGIDLGGRDGLGARAAVAGSGLRDPGGRAAVPQEDILPERKRPSLPDQTAIAPGNAAATGRMAAGLYVFAARGRRIRQRRADAIAAEECTGRGPDALRRG